MNSMKKSVLASLFMASVILTVSSAQSATVVNVGIGIAPPPPRVEYRPSPRRGHIWIPGYWAWDGGRHVWVEGHWERARRGYHYVEPRWALVGNQWVFYPGYWAAAAPPPTVIAPAQQPVYIERGDEQAAPQRDPGHSYYCHNPDGYYPYVKQCPGGWEKVGP